MQHRLQEAGTASKCHKTSPLAPASERVEIAGTDWSAIKIHLRLTFACEGGGGGGDGVEIARNRQGHGVG